MEKVTIKPVVTQKNLRRFIRFPFSLYSKNPYWAPGLDFDERKTLSTKNPTLKHCDLEMFLAYRGSKVVGRIALIINHTYNDAHGCLMGRFGWFDFIDDLEVSGSLLGEAKRWAQEKGMLELHGPLGFNDFDYQGFLVEGHDSLGTMSTIYNYPYYNDHMLHWQFEKQVDWIERTISKKHSTWSTQSTQRIANLVAKRSQVSLVQPKTKKELLNYVQQVFELINREYKDLYGFVPFTQEEILYYINSYFSVAIKDYIPIVVDQNDRVVAFMIVFPSFTKALQKAKGRLFPFGWLYMLRAMRQHRVAELYLGATDKAYQNKGLLALMYSQLTKALDKRGVEYCETNVVLESNVEMNTVYSNERSDYVYRIVKRRRCYSTKL